MPVPDSTGDGVLLQVEWRGIYTVYVLDWMERYNYVNNIHTSFYYRVFYGGLCIDWIYIGFV